MSERTTTDGQPPRPGYETAPAPAPVNPATGQHEAYWVLSEEERAKGFVRPVRLSYVHVGIAGPQHGLESVADDSEWVRAMRELGHEVTDGPYFFERYPRTSPEQPVGRYWSQKQLAAVNNGCHTMTTMRREIAETYAAKPGFYGATFCVQCRRHLPVGRDGEFVWADAAGTPTTERVGT